MNTFEIGDSVVLKEPYRGYYNAEIIGFDSRRVIIEICGSGLRMTVLADELEN